MNIVSDYFNGDSMASDVWRDKYQLKDNSGNPQENTPRDMHYRMAREFARIEYDYSKTEAKALHADNVKLLSKFGLELLAKRVTQTEEQIVEELFSYFDKFKYIIPQGSIMTNLGNNYKYGSLSNCFVVASPVDSYGGILKTDQELVQLMKRRGGVGTTLDFLRPTEASVTNAAGTSTGVPSFAERYSNSTREVGQDGRRGALMLLLSVKHPDIFRFVTMKEDRTKVTGANISVMFTNEFLAAAENGEDFTCVFPTNYKGCGIEATASVIPYNKLHEYLPGKYLMRIKASELLDTFVEMAWSNAEPGAAYIDTIQDYSPDGVYEQYRPTKCNPCGEIWMSDYDACRLIAQNFFSMVDNPFTDSAKLNTQKLYEVSYIQQRLGDNLVDLEIEKIEKIIGKIKSDPESLEVKQAEIDLWTKIRDKAKSGRRTGSGFTGLGDMLAALGVGYDSQDGLDIIDEVMNIKMQAELDATIDMAITRGAFDGWDGDAEFESEEGFVADGKNSFFRMLVEEFPQQAQIMFEKGRRNVSWSTVAPTGTVSLMTQTTSGLEPLFKAFYIRRKKVNDSNENVRVDFIDQNGDKWQEYAVLHPKFEQWCMVNNHSINTKQEVEEAFKLSPWYQSQADDISWKKRVEIQAIIQKYTSNAISSTINLPTDVSKEVVRGIYLTAWKMGLKGVTVYREGSRTGVLVSESKPLTNKDEFGYTDAFKRPEELEADYYFVRANSKKYAVIVGKMDGNPYEVFAFENPLLEAELKGSIFKKSTGVYEFKSKAFSIENLQVTSTHPDEKLLTRWVSMLLRHGANPKFIIDQVEKSETSVVSFTKALARVLKKYVPDEATGETCPNCNEHTMIREEGCKKCSSCGYSKC